jgi:hypothetical protein
LRSLPRNYAQFEFPRELLFFRRLSILRVAGGVYNHSRDLLWMGFVHGVARVLDFGRMALGPRVVSALKVRIDDLIIPGDDSPARLRLPGDVGSVRGDIDEANDIGVNAGFRDDRAAVAMPDQECVGPS